MLPKNHQKPYSVNVLIDTKVVVDVFSDQLELVSINIVGTARDLLNILVRVGEQQHTTRLTGKILTVKALTLFGEVLILAPVG